MTKTWLYEITASDPPTEERRWRNNITVHVVTDTVESAIDIFRGSYPESDINKVERRNRTGEGVLVDPRYS